MKIVNKPAQVCSLLKKYLVSTLDCLLKVGNTETRDVFTKEIRIKPSHNILDKTSERNGLRH